MTRWARQLIINRFISSLCPENSRGRAILAVWDPAMFTLFVAISVCGSGWGWGLYWRMEWRIGRGSASVRMGKTLPNRRRFVDQVQGQVPRLHWQSHQFWGYCCYVWTQNNVCVIESSCVLLGLLEVMFGWFLWVYSFVTTSKVYVINLTVIASKGSIELRYRCLGLTKFEREYMIRVD